MYLATVTCNRDFQQMLLQAESIQKFLDPCKHIIIINEAAPDLEFWRRWLEPYYTNHELILLAPISYLYPMNVIGRATGHGYFINGDTHIGWRTQQLQKLLLAYNFEDDYLLLDSKNFFIKKCNILDWDNMIGSGKCLPIDLEGHAYYQTAQVYKEILDSNVTHYFHPITPFKIVRKNIVSNIKLSELGYLLFYPEHAIKPPHISEGVLYGFFLSEEEKINMTSGQNKALFNKYLGLWSHHSGEILKLVTESTRDIYVIAGVHRTLLNSMTHDDLKILNHWVSSLDLTNKITPLPYN